eukprot:2697026-Rhodomonas_salina.1
MFTEDCPKKTTCKTMAYPPNCTLPSLAPRRNDVAAATPFRQRGCCGDVDVLIMEPAVNFELTANSCTLQPYRAYARSRPSVPARKPPHILSPNAPSHSIAGISVLCCRARWTVRSKDNTGMPGSEHGLDKTLWKAPLLGQPIFVTDSVVI